MSVIKFFKSRIFWINVGLAIVAMVALYLLFFQLLGGYTNHNDEMILPDLHEKHIDIAVEELRNRGLRDSIIDSVYVPDKPILTVTKQNPKPGSKVKENRMVYLTITMPNPPKVELPNIVDMPRKVAIANLKSRGLEAGQEKYVPYIAKNLVLGMQINGKSVEPGELFDKGTAVDLVLGDGRGSKKRSVPDLKGQPLDVAVLLIKSNGFTVGETFFDNSVRDKSQSRVYRQEPKPGEGQNSGLGQAIDIWLTSPDDFIQREFPDTMETEPIEGGEGE